jgi:hypothetical protein
MINNIQTTAPIKMEIKAEDLRINIEIQDASLGTIECEDFLTSENTKKEISTTEIGAILFLLCSDQADDGLTDEMYSILERNNTFLDENGKEWPPHLRPVP